MNLGYVNNNPLNIRFSPMNTWKGQIGSYRGFCKFSDMKYGCRAALTLLCNYHRKGYDTIREIISRWAPASENDTEAYINYVASDPRLPAGFNRDTHISDFRTLLIIAKSMSEVEIGHRYAADIDVADGAWTSAVNNFTYPNIK